jgi:predicted NUDIX family phosphoesterase
MSSEVKLSVRVQIDNAEAKERTVQTIDYTLLDENDWLQIMEKLDKKAKRYDKSSTLRRSLDPQQTMTGI